MGLRIVRRSDRDGNPKAKKGKGIAASPLFEAMPAVWEFLTITAWEDKKVRETGTILIFVEDGVVKLCLNDRDQNQVAFVSAPTVEEALAGVEEGLVGDTLEWRLSRRAKQGRS